MSQKTLTILLLAAGILAAIYFVAVPAMEPSTTSSEHRLFSGVESQGIAHISIEQGTENVKLSLKDGVWQLPARSGYPADGGKIRALLLKIFDLSVSQRIPGDSKSHEKLGVDLDGVKRGFAHIEFSDVSGKVIAGLRLGDSRKTKDKSPAGLLSGQYVRRDDEDDVYLLGSPLTVTTGVASWLDVNLLNLLPNSVRSIIQSKKSERGEEVVFELVRSGKNDSSGLPEFTLKDGVPAGKSLQDPVITQVSGGLENLRVSDVRPTAAEEVKDAQFDMSTVYKSMNGLVYRIDTAKKGEKYYAKINVVFDPELAKEIENEAAASQPSPIPSPSPSPMPIGTPAPDASPAPKETPMEKKAELKLSNDEDAKKLSGQYAPWIYEVPTYSARKLRYSKQELVEPPPPPSPPPSPPPGQAQSGGMDLPPSMAPPHAAVQKSSPKSKK